MMVPLSQSVGRMHVSGKRIVGVLDDGMPRFVLDGETRWLMADDPEEPYVECV